MIGKFGQPVLPRGIMRDLVELRAGNAAYDPENGGQWSRGQVERVPFKGCVLPMSEDDWRTAPQGTYTKESRKIYTDGHELCEGSGVYDPQDGATYTVKGDLNHGTLHPMRRYVVERKGVSAPR